MKHARLLAGSILLVALGAICFSSTGRDDAHITYWPAATLASGGGIVNYDGDRVEQSSSLLLTVILAFLEKATGAALPTLGSVASIAAGAGAAYLAGRASTAWAGALAGTSAAFVYWSWSGLETALAGLCGLWLVLRVTAELEPDRRVLPGWATLAALLAFLLVRPESGLVALVMLVATFVLFRERRRKLGALIGVTVLLFLGIGAGRLAYFGTFFPQPVLAKSVGLSPYAVVGGLGYLARHGLTLAILPGALLALVGLRGIRSASPRVKVAALFVAADLLFVVCSGGDWMESGRFLAHLWPVACVVAAAGLAAIPFRNTIAVAAIVAQIGGVAVLARTKSTGTPCWTAGASNSDDYSWFERANRIHLRDIPLITRLESEVAAIGAKRPGPVRLMTGQMGMIPFHLALRHFGAFTVLDTRGLTDRRLTTCAVTKGRPRSSIGLVLSYRDYFERAAEIESSCGIPRPEVVFDLGEYYDDVVSHGYVPIYRDQAPVPSGSSLFPGDRLDRGTFIAVRADLAP